MYQDAKLQLLRFWTQNLVFKTHKIWFMITVYRNDQPQIVMFISEARTIYFQGFFLGFTR